MATIRLIPSTYAVSGTSYLTVDNESNMYSNTDSTMYATITNINASTSSRYLYIRGFNFDSIPTGAVINSFTVKIKGYESGLATSTSYAPRLANGTSALSNTTASENFSTSTKTITIPTGALTWEQISNTYGSNFTIMVYVRRNNKNTTGYFYCHGAEIEVNYTVIQPRTITSTLTGSGTINPSGANSVNDGDTYTLTITPTNINDSITVKNNNVDVTSQLIGGYTGGTQSSTSQTAASYTSSGSMSNSTYISYPVGYTAESPHTYSSNVYASSNGSTAYVDYSFNFSSLPSDAAITAIEVKSNGQRENASNGPCEVTLYSDSTQKGTTQAFTSTSQQTITVSDPGDWTRAELQNAKLRWSIGYYGGRLYGITWKVTYTSGGSLTYYTYTYTVTEDATIAVTIGSSSQPTIYYKVNGSWVAATAVYKKVNGSWVLQSNLANVFDNNVNYVKG